MIQLGQLASQIRLQNSEPENYQNSETGGSSNLYYKHVVNCALDLFALQRIEKSKEQPQKKRKDTDISDFLNISCSSSSQYKSDQERSVDHITEYKM